MTFLILTICSTSFLPAQQIVVTGVVLDGHSKEPIPFANVYLKSDPSKGVSADFDGIFEITFGCCSNQMKYMRVGS